jgi:hypothetical protein
MFWWASEREAFRLREAKENTASDEFIDQILQLG